MLALDDIKDLKAAGDACRSLIDTFTSGCATLEDCEIALEYALKAFGLPKDYIDDPRAFIPPEEAASSEPVVAAASSEPEVRITLNGAPVTNPMAAVGALSAFYSELSLLNVTPKDAYAQFLDRQAADDMPYETAWESATEAAEGALRTEGIDLTDDDVVSATYA